MLLCTAAEDFILNNGWLSNQWIWWTIRCFTIDSCRIGLNVYDDDPQSLPAKVPYVVHVVCSKKKRVH